MALTKRLLSVALAVLLGLAALAPGVMAEDDPYAPIITKQPKASVTVFVGKTLVLEVEAELSDGVEGTLSYAWYSYSNQYGTRKIGNSANLVLPITDDMFDTFGESEKHSIYAVVTNTYVDEEGQEQTASTESDPSSVTMVKRFGDWLFSGSMIERMRDDFLYYIFWSLVLHPEITFVGVIVYFVQFLTLPVQIFRYIRFYIASLA